MLHVAQISFFTDPKDREPQALLSAWPALVDAADAAARAGLRVSVIQAHSHRSSLTRDGVEYFFLPFGCGAAGRATYAAFDELLRELAPHVLHVHGLGFAADVIHLAGVAPDTPILLQDHANGLPPTWRRREARRAFAAASGLAFCSVDQVRPYKAARLLPAALPVYEVPESTARFDPGEPDGAHRTAAAQGDPLILWVGNLDPNKDPLTVLDGIRAAALVLPGLRLWMCFGSASLLSEVKAKIAGDPVLRERVHLLGEVPHVRVEQLMRAADALVLGSHHEGSGFALIEALACGLAPVVTDIPSFRALTGGGRVGALWTPGDGAKLCEALLSIVARPRHATRAAVRAHFEAELSFEALGRKLRRVYEDLLRRRAAAVRGWGTTRSGQGARASESEAVGQTAARTALGSGGRPLVSIVLPTFNRLHYLRTTVDSILHQTQADWELLIADDGSALETREYLTQLADPRIHVIWLPHTGNPAAARNAAMQRAAGEFIAFIDSDDVWVADKLDAQVGALRLRPECGWAYCGFAMVTGSGAALTGQRALRCPPLDGWVLEALLNQAATIVMSSVLARRSLIDDAGGFDERFWVCEELELWLRFALRSEIAFVDAPLVHVRRHAEHYADDVTSCEDLARMFDELRHGEIATALPSAFRRRRAIGAAVLARSYADHGRRALALRALTASVGYGWPDRDWWWRGLGTAAVALAPALLHRLRRSLRPARVATDAPPEP